MLGARRAPVNERHAERAPCTLARMSSAPQAGRASWVALAAFALLALGLGLAWQQSRPHRPTLPPVPEGEPAAGAIDQALQQASPAFDSTAYKQRWLDEVRGADVAGLDARRLELFLRHANAAQCTCGCGYSLAGCRASDMTCDVSGGRVQALLDSIRAGQITSARGIRARPRE